MSLTARATYASELRILVNAGNLQNLSQREITDIYTGDLTHWASNSRILPALLSTSNSSTEAMLNETISMKPDEFSSHWRRKLFSGMGIPPREFDSVSGLVAYIAKTTNAIGLAPELPKDAASEDLKKVRVLIYSTLHPTSDTQK